MLWTHGVREGRVSENLMVAVLSTNQAKVHGMAGKQGRARTRRRRRHRGVGPGPDDHCDAVQPARQRRLHALRGHDVHGQSGLGVRARQARLPRRRGGRPGRLREVRAPVVLAARPRPGRPLMAAVDAARAVEGLQELRAPTGTTTAPNGSRGRTRGSRRASGCARSSTRSTASTVETDEAGNLWATLPGDSDARADRRRPPGLGAERRLARRLPERARRRSRCCARIAGRGPPPVTLRLVDWADEEGARFGRSLFGSSAAAGSLDPDDVRGLTDRDGVALPDALARARRRPRPRARRPRRLDGAAAYLELHIEQGPVLEQMDMPLGVVLGTFGVERHAVRFTGQAAHVGRDADAPAPRRVPRRRALALEFREIAAARATTSCTIGSVKSRPGIVTACRRHAASCRSTSAPSTPEVLAEMLAAAQEASRADRRRGGLRGRVGAHVADRADPVPSGLIDLARRGRRGDRRHAPPAPQRPAARRRRDGRAGSRP